MILKSFAILATQGHGSLIMGREIAVLVRVTAEKKAVG